MPLPPLASLPPLLTDPSNKEEDGRISRLVLAAAQQLADGGPAATSARSVATAAGSAASAINYNFGSVEQLFSSAYSHGAALTGEWLDGRRLEIAALPRTADGAALALEYLIAQWTGPARALALLYQECLAATVGRGPGAAWMRLWRDFWLECASGFGLGEIEGRLLHLIFESEALYHLSSWSPALEQAALREICGHFGEVWLGSEPRPSAGALALAERTAGVLPEGSIAPGAVKIVEAAAGVIEERGLGGLTHRAVAARAGVTTGAVTHHFRTVEDLVAGAIRGQVNAMSKAITGDQEPVPAPVATLDTAEDLFGAIHAIAVADRPVGPALGRRRLFLAAVRRPDLASAAAVIRFAYGATTRDALGRIFDIPGGTLSLHAGVLSRLLASIWFACSADEAPRAMRAALAEEIQARFERVVKVR